MCDLVGEFDLFCTFAPARYPECIVEILKSDILQGFQTPRYNSALTSCFMNGHLQSYLEEYARLLNVEVEMISREYQPKTGLIHLHVLFLLYIWSNLNIRDAVSLSEIIEVGLYAIKRAQSLNWGIECARTLMLNLC